MGSVTEIRQARFAVGELVRHKLFDYRGVVFDVDSNFQLSEEWYERMARSRPPKDAPWYHVLVHGATHSTYVAERNLQADPDEDPVLHPMLAHFFTAFENGRYIRHQRSN